MTARRLTFGVAGGAGLGLAALLARNVIKYKRATGERFELLQSPQPGTPEFAHLIEAMTGASQRSGNRVEIVRNGATLDSMVAAISGATRTIDFSSYIYWPGPTADRFSEALAERARAGVAVNLLLDGYGSAKLDREHQERLRRSGVHVATFRPPRWHTIHQANNRMHRRVLIVDGAVGFAGGVGIADVWTGDAEDPEHWRETHLRIQGPALRELYGAFLETWTEATGEVLSHDHIPEAGDFEDGVEVLVSRGTGRASLLRQAARCRCPHLRVRPDDAACEGDPGRWRMGQRGVRQLRQPVARSRSRAERRRERPGLCR